MTYDELDAVFDTVEKIPENRSYIPTVEDMEAHGVSKDPEKFLPYLVWVSEMLAGTKKAAEKEANRYINNIVNAVCAG